MMGLQTEIAKKLWYFRTGAVMSKDDHPSPLLLSQAKQILPKMRAVVEGAELTDKKIVAYLDEHHPTLTNILTMTANAQRQAILKAMEGK